MKPMTPFYLGDIVEMKKTHPCGEKRWEVVRLGMDIRAKCLGCGRQVLLSRRKFERAVRRVLESPVGDSMKEDEGESRDSGPA